MVTVSTGRLVPVTESARADSVGDLTRIDSFIYDDWRYTCTYILYVYIICIYVCMYHVYIIHILLGVWKGQCGMVTKNWLWV